MYVMLLSIKYWMHINDEEISKSHNKCTFQSLINGDEIKSSYGEQIQNFLKIIGFDHVWLKFSLYGDRLRYMGYFSLNIFYLINSLHVYKQEHTY